MKYEPTTIERRFKFTCENEPGERGNARRCRVIVVIIVGGHMEVYLYQESLGDREARRLWYKTR
jgi:hypothetical protein